MLGFPVLCHLPEFAQAHVQWCHPTISFFVVPFSSWLQSFSATWSFTMSWLFASGGPSIGASASSSVLPMNIQGWFPIGLTGLILLSKGLSGIFNSTIWKHQFFSLSFGHCLKKEIELSSTFRRPAKEAQGLYQGPIDISAQEVHRHGPPSQKPCLGFPGIASRRGNCPFHRCWNWGLWNFHGVPGQTAKSSR